jgi:hypothetical protein
MHTAQEHLYLPELFEALQGYISLDAADWRTLTRYALKWHLSLADALLDMRFVDETSLAQALGTARRLPYLAGNKLTVDTQGLSFDCLEDLLGVGAIPITEGRLAICNPYDDHRGLLRPDLAARDMVVTERAPLYAALHTLCMRDWDDADDLRLDDRADETQTDSEVNP